MKYKQYFLYLLFFNGPKNCTVPGKGYIESETSPTGVTDTSTGTQSAPHSKKTMISVTGKYLRNFSDSSTSLRDYNDSKLKLVGYTTSTFGCDKLYAAILSQQ